MRKLILILASLFILGCNQGEDMATIGEETSLELVTTNVTDSTEEFNNTIHQNYPKGTQYEEGSSIYENTGDDIVVSAYDVADEYVVNQIVFKDSLVKKVIGVSGDFPKQPEDYTSTDTSFNDDDWAYRYMKFKNIPSGGSTDGVNIDTQATSPNDVAFNSAGTKMFEVCINTDKISEYALSVAWDLSTATYTDSISTQDTSPTGIAFSSNGTKMFEIGTTSDKIYEYTLSTGWDISTASYVDSINTQDSNPMGVTFNSDGTKMFEIGSGSDKIYEYALSTEWDISTATYTDSISTQSNVPSGIAFNSDGTKMYEVYYSKIYIYALSTGWDISTASYTEGDYIFTQDNIATGIAFKSDGTKMYESGASGDKIYEYVLGTAWNVSTAFYSIFPAIYEETRDSVLYTYKIEESGGDYTFTSINGGNSDNYTPMTVHTHLDDSSVEHKAYTGSNGTWLAKTMIARPAGVYIRTSIDAAIEYETLTDYQFSTVDLVSNVVGFSRIGASNPYKPFDGSNITPAKFTSPMTYTVRGLEEFNSFTLAKVLASSLVYTFKYPEDHAQYVLWLDGSPVASGGNGIVKTDTVSIDCARDCDNVLSKYPTTIILYADTQMLIDTTNNEYPLVEISLTYDDCIYLGDFTLNNSITGGFTNMEFTHGIQDFNDYTPNPWGAIPVATKAIVTKFNITVDIYLENYDHCVSFNESVAGKFVTIDASDSGGEASDSLNIFASLIRRVIVTSVSAKTVVKDGELYKMAGVTLAVQEVV